MHKFLQIASAFAKNAKSEGESFLSRIGNVILTLVLPHILPFLLPALAIIFVCLTLAGVLSYKLNVLQYVDGISSNGGSTYTNTSGGTGNYNYSDSDFQKCVETTSSVGIAGSYDEFVSNLSSSTDSNFRDINSFNSYIKNTVNAAGYGTAAGVVAAAMSLSCSYSNATGKKLFYYCENPSASICNSTEEYMEGVQPEIRLDCRGFVFWSLYNGGFQWPEQGSIKHNSSFMDWAASNGYYMDDVTSGKPGDIVTKSGHILLIVGNYDGGYYCAEEAGHEAGLIIRTRDYDNLTSVGYRIVNMNEHYYNNPSNKR